MDAQGVQIRSSYPCRICNKHDIRNEQALYSQKINKNKNKITIAKLTAANLPLRNRSNPGNDDIHGNYHGTNNIKYFWIIGAVIPKDNCKDDTSEIAKGSNKSGEYSISMRVHVWSKRKVGTITSFHGNRH